MMRTSVGPAAEVAVAVRPSGAVTVRPTTYVPLSFGVKVKLEPVVGVPVEYADPFLATLHAYVYGPCCPGESVTVLPSVTAVPSGLSGGAPVIATWSGARTVTVVVKSRNPPSLSKTRPNAVYVPGVAYVSCPVAEVPAPE